MPCSAGAGTIGQLTMRPSVLVAVTRAAELRAAAQRLPPMAATTARAIVSFRTFIRLRESTARLRCPHVPEHQNSLQLRAADNLGRGRGRGAPVRAQGQRNDKAVAGERGGLQP